MPLQGALSPAPEVAAASGRALAACEALLHPRAPPFPAALPPSHAPAATRALGVTPASAPPSGLHGEANGGAGGSAGAYLGVPRMWSAVAAWDALEPQGAAGAQHLGLVQPPGLGPGERAAQAPAAARDAGPAAASPGDMEVDGQAAEQAAVALPHAAPMPELAPAPHSGPPPAAAPAAAKQAADLDRASEPLADFLSLDVPVATAAAAIPAVAGNAAPHAARRAAAGAPLHPGTAGSLGVEVLVAVPDAARSAGARAGGQGAGLGPVQAPGNDIGAAPKPGAAPAGRGGPGSGLGSGLGADESEDSEGPLPDIDSGQSSSDEESGIEE